MLQDMLDKLKAKVQKVRFGWTEKVEQLAQIKEILHKERFNITGLVNEDGIDDGISELAEDIAEALSGTASPANATASPANATSVSADSTTDDPDDFTDDPDDYTTASPADSTTTIENVVERQ